MVAQVPWGRIELLEAGISIDRHPEWTTLEEDRSVSQRFAGEGFVSARWGQGATVEDVLAHVGLGSGGTRTIEADEHAVVDGIPARRVRLRIVDPEAYSHEPGTARAPEREWIYVAIGFMAGQTPVLVSYSLPASQVAAMTPLAEHVLTSIRKRREE